MSKKMSRYPTDRKVYVGDLGNNARKNDLEYAFGAFGALRSVWIARNPPGFAFVEFEDARDAADAVRGLDGRTVCGRRARVELSTGKFAGGGRGSDRRGGGGGNDRARGGGGGGGRGDDKCYECGGRGHYARHCRERQARNRRRSNSRSSSRSISRRRKSRSRSAVSRSRSHSRSASLPRENRRSTREVHGKTRENGRGENGDSSRYSDDERNGGTESPIPSKRRYEDDDSPSPKRGSQSKRGGRSISRRRGGSSISRSRSSSRKD